MRRFVVLVALVGIATVGNATEQAADAETEMQRADAYMVQRNYQAAIAHYNAAKILAPARPGPYRGLGMAYYAAGQCAEAIPVLEEYLRKKQQDPWPQAVHALADCKGQVAPPPPPPPMSRAERLRAQREADDKRVQLEEYERTQGVEQGLKDQIRVRFEREKMDVCGSGAEYHFCTVSTPLTENDFVRRYQKLTGSRELNYALKMRNKVGTGVWAGIGLAGVGLILYGALTLSHPCTLADMSKSDCQNASGTFDSTRSITDSTSQDILLIGAGVQFGASIIWLLYGGLKTDGNAGQHFIPEYDAHLYVEKYNRALQRKIHADLAAGQTSGALEQPEPETRPQASRVRVIPYLGGLRVAF